MLDCTISNVRDIFQILFFITISTITVLTYLKAKRTLLQPIKTEVFKEQIKIFSDILNFFKGKKELDLRNEMYFQKLIDVNCRSLLDDYAYAYFKIEFDKNVRPYNLSKCSSRVISKVILFECVKRLINLADVSQPGILGEKQIEQFKYVYAKEFIKVQGDDLNGLINDLDGLIKFILNDISQFYTLQEEESALEKERFEWKDYIYLEIKIPNETNNKVNELEKIMDSPLIPKKLYNLLEKYKITVNKNVALVSDILNECSQELPNRYPDIEALEKANLGWIYTKYFFKLTPLEKRAKEITDYIRDYFDTDNLFK